MAASRFLINRKQNVLLTQQHKQKEWTNILHIAKANGYPRSTIIKLNTHIQNRLQHPKTNTIPSNNKKWVTFTFHSPIIRRITNIFRNTNLKITFQTNNSLHNILNTKHQNNNYNTYTLSGIYEMKCHTCKQSYIGQTGRFRIQIQRTHQIHKKQQWTIRLWYTYIK